MRYITLEFLETHKACDSHRERFRAAFGSSVELTDENVLKALAAGLDVLWLEQVLDELFPTLWEAYHKDVEQMSEVYRNTIRPVRDAHAIELERIQRPFLTRIEKIRNARQGAELDYECTTQTKDDYTRKQELRDIMAPFNQQEDAEFDAMCEASKATRQAYDTWHQPIQEAYVQERSLVLMKYFRDISE